MSLTGVNTMTYRQSEISLFLCNMTHLISSHILPWNHVLLRTPASVTNPSFRENSSSSNCGMDLSPGPPETFAPHPNAHAATEIRQR